MAGRVGSVDLSTNFNISAAVGYIAAFGVSVLNGVVLASSIRQAVTEGLPLREAIARGCEIRFRPIVVSAIVAVIGFLPAALSQGIGSEIQRPLDWVVIGGLISSTILTLLVLPAICALFAGRRQRRTPPSGSPAEMAGSRASTGSGMVRAVCRVQAPGGSMDSSAPGSTSAFPMPPAG